MEDEEEGYFSPTIHKIQTATKEKVLREWKEQRYFHCTYSSWHGRGGGGKPHHHKILSTPQPPSLPPPPPPPPIHTLTKTLHYLALAHSLLLWSKWFLILSFLSSL